MKKITLLIVLMSILVCGCSKSEVAQGSTATIEDTTTIEDTSQVDNSTAQSTTSNIQSTDKDDTVVAYFDEANASMDTYTSHNLKDKATSAYTNLVDFILYDGEIKGIKFSELKDSTKQKILKTATTVDNKIESKWPGYKDTIKTNGTKVYQGVTSKLKNLLSSYNDKLKDTIGEKTYNETKDSITKQTSGAKKVINDIKSGVKNVTSSASTSIKSWLNKKN